MLPDPFTIAAAAPTPELVFSVVKSDGYGSERRTPTGEYALVMTHENSKSNERHYLKLTQVKDATNPYSGGVSKQTANVSISASIPPFGWSAAEKAALVKAAIDTLLDSEVTIAKWIQFQS